MSINNDKELPTESLQSVDAINKFSERSDEVQEIISRKPDFTEKWALIIFLSILLSVVIGSWFVHYPEIIKVRATLTGNVAPMKIIPLQTGRLIKLFVQNNQQIHKGDQIAWIESTANTQEVLDLSEELQYGTKLLSDGKSVAVSKIFMRKFNNLGELQTAYQSFIISLERFNDNLLNGYYANRKEFVHRDITSLKDMGKTKEEINKLSDLNNEILPKSFEMNDTLQKGKFISLEDYRKAMNIYLNKKMPITQTESNIVSRQTQILEKQKELDQHNHDILQQKTVFEEAINTLRSSVDDWINKYILRSTMDGIVAFALPLEQNPFVERGKVLCFINPNETKFHAELKLTQNNLSKIDTGMQVQLRFDAYPYQEFGFVKGTLNYISTNAIDSSFLGTVRLNNGLQTNRQTKIQYKSGLKAEAVIITKDMRLLQRLYYNLLKSISKSI